MTSFRRAMCLALPVWTRRGCSAGWARYRREDWILRQSAFESVISAFCFPNFCFSQSCFPNFCFSLCQAFSPSLLCAGNSDTVNKMTVDQIKEEVSNLPETQQDQLVAYVVHLRHMRDASTRQELNRRMGDRDPAHWISVDQLKERWKE